MSRKRIHKGKGVRKTQPPPQRRSIASQRRWRYRRRYMPLAPPRWVLKAKDPELFDREYRKQLESLDAKQVAQDIGANAIILCWESFNVRCHRRLVAEWLEEKLGIVVPELEHERADSLPFNQQPSKWDAEPAAPQL